MPPSSTLAPDIFTLICSNAYLEMRFQPYQKPGLCFSGSKSLPECLYRVFIGRPLANLPPISSQEIISPQPLTEWLFTHSDNFPYHFTLNDVKFFYFSNREK
jgi:hypothetical protein